MPRVTTVQSARKDQGKCGRCGDPLPAGSAYRHWSFRFGGKYKRCMKPSCNPRSSELTQNDTLVRAYEITEEDIETFETFEDFEEAVDDFVAQVGEVLEIIQEKMDNIESGFGHTDLDIYYELEEQYGEVEGWAEQIEGVKNDFSEEEFDGETARDALQEAVTTCPV